MFYSAVNDIRNSLYLHAKEACWSVAKGQNEYCPLLSDCLVPGVG